MRTQVPRVPPVLASHRSTKRSKVFIVALFACFFAGLISGLMMGKRECVCTTPVPNNAPNRTKRSLISLEKKKMVIDDVDVASIKLPETIRPAHISDEFVKWKIPEMTQKALYKALLGAPVNPKTGKQCIMFSVANEGMIAFATNMYCSMRLAGIPRDNHVMVALDEASYKAMKSIDAQVIYLESNFTLNAVNNNHLIDFNDICKVRPTILHQILLWGFEAILLDTDTVFLENPLSIFNDEADFEVQCDSKEYTRVPSHIHPVVWQANLGFFKVHPTPVVMELFPHWFTRMYNSSKINDQIALRKVLKKMPTRWINDDTLTLQMRRLYAKNDEDLAQLTFRFLDPMYICNAGGLYQENMTNWVTEAHRRQIKRPWFIHYFHIGYVGSKLAQMKNTDMWFVDQGFKCLAHQTKECTEWTLWNKPETNTN